MFSTSRLAHKYSKLVIDQATLTLHS